MKLISIAVILSAVGASQVGRQAPAVDYTSRDDTVVMKVSPKVFQFIKTVNGGGSSNFYPYITGICKNDAGSTTPGKPKYNQSGCKDKFREWRSAIVDAKANNEREYAQEEENFEPIRYVFGNNDETNKVIGLFGRLTALDKKEYEYALDLANSMESRLGGEVESKSVFDRFKQLAEAAQSLYRGQSFTGAVATYIKQNWRARPRDAESITGNFKKWVIGNVIFGNQKGVATDPNPFSFVAPQFNAEDFVRSLAANNPDRFKISPIEKKMNFSYFAETFPKADMEALKRYMKSNFDMFKRKTQNASWSAENEIRQEVLDSLMDNPSNLNKELLFARVKIFERVLQGIMLGIKVGEPVSDETVDKYVKLWLMAKQMIEPDGWKASSAKFGLHALPDGFTPADPESLPEDQRGPVTKTEAEAPTRTMPESNANNNNNASTESKTETPATNVPVAKDVTVEKVSGKDVTRVRSNTVDTIKSTDSNVSEKSNEGSRGGLMSYFFGSKQPVAA